MIHHRITPTVALTLALAATAAPVAAADPQPLAQAEAAIANASTHSQPSSGLCSEACSGHGYSTVHLTTATPASTGPRSEVVSGGGYGPVSAPATVVRVVVPSSGFDWGDAGIGAGSILVLIGLGGVLAATNRRGRQTQDQHLSAIS
jgi:hypothetical protein